ncbi:ester cyclase [Kribbella sp. NPDC002412]
MSRDVVAEVEERTIAAWSEHDVEGIVAMLAEKFVWTDVGLPEPMRTLDEVRAYVRGWIDAFPDLRVNRTNRVVADDAVAGEVEFIGTNTGPLVVAGNQIPPTGRSIVGRGAYFAHFEGNHVTEFHAYPDLAGMMTQLGLMRGA